MDNKRTLIYLFKGVNTSAEWIKKGQKKKNLVNDVSRASGSLSATRAVTVRQTVKILLPPTSDRHSAPCSACMPEHAVYTSNQMAII